MKSRHEDQTQQAGVLQEMRTLVERRFRHFARAPGRIIGVLANPMIYLMIFSVLFREAFVVPKGYATLLDYVAPGILLVVAISAIPTGALAVREDLDSGLMDRLRTLPTRRTSIVASYLISETLLVGVVTLIVAAVALLLGWRDIDLDASLMTRVVVLITFAYLSAVLAFLLGLYVRKATTIESIASLLVIFLAFFSSLLLPLATQPETMQSVTKYNPINAVAIVLRNGEASSTVMEFLVLSTLVCIATLATILSIRHFGRRWE